MVNSDAITPIPIHEMRARRYDWTTPGEAYIASGEKR